jgi:hypothetical protein
MGDDRFTVLRRDGPRGRRWLVRRGEMVYGEYLDARSAVQDATEAAEESAAELVIEDDAQA